jgi:hypothetical protein
LHSASYLNRLVAIEDWSALMDVSGALLGAAGGLLLVTTALNVALLRKLHR